MVSCAFLSVGEGEQAVEAEFFVAHDVVGGVGRRHCGGPDEVGDLLEVKFKKSDNTTDFKDAIGEFVYYGKGRLGTLFRQDALDITPPSTRQCARELGGACEGNRNHIGPTSQ